MTSTTVPDGQSVVTGEQMTEIAQEVWESFLSMSLLPHPLGPDAPALEGQTVTGCVHVSGEWTGSVFLSCHLEVATAAAEAMFAADPGSLSADEVSDALGPCRPPPSARPARSASPAPSCSTGSSS
jgi:hypothetical protein